MTFIYSNEKHAYKKPRRRYIAFPTRLQNSFQLRYIPPFFRLIVLSIPQEGGKGKGKGPSSPFCLRNIPHCRRFERQDKSQECQVRQATPVDRIVAGNGQKTVSLSCLFARAMRRVLSFSTCTYSMCESYRRNNFAAEFFFLAVGAPLQ